MKKNKINDLTLKSWAMMLNNIKDKGLKIDTAYGLIYHPLFIMTPTQFSKLCAWCSLLPNDLAPNADGNYLAELFLKLVTSFPQEGGSYHAKVAFMGWLFYQEKQGEWRTLEGGHGYNDMIMNGVLNTIRQNPETAETFRMALAIYEAENDNPSLKPDVETFFKSKKP